ncbi:MAG: RNA-binding domain-containing protein [archaeon]
MNEIEFKLIISEGEGQFIEFKESIDKSLAKEIVAFSNASGGKILVGIKDNKEVLGINITNRIKSEITDIARKCDPSIKLSFDNYKNILIINVSEGEDKPYQCSEGFFIRFGPNSQKLNRSEIISFNIKYNKIRFDEQICEEFSFKDFDNDKFKYYLKLANISKSINKENILRNLNVLTDKGFRNAGVLFFAKEPSKFISSSQIRCVHFKDDERVEILDKKEIDKGIIGNIEFATNYLKERVPVRYEITGLHRKEFPQFPFEAYREAIVNAVVHRDYFEVGDVAVEKLKNSIIVNNFGGISNEFLKKQFGKISIPRNRIIADLLSKTDLMEKVGTGINRMKNHCRKNNNNLEFRYDEFYFLVEFKSESNSFEHINKFEIVDNKVANKVANKSSQKILYSLDENPKITIAELSRELNLNASTIKKSLSNLKKQGLIKREGSKKIGNWIIKSNNSLKKDRSRKLSYRSEKVDSKVDNKVDSKSSQKILYLLDENPKITIAELSRELNLNASTIKKSLSNLKKKAIIKREGSDKKGKWIILK